MGITGEATVQSTVTAIYDVGCFLGAISTIWIGEKFGRKNTIVWLDPYFRLIGTTIMSVGAVLQIAAYSYSQMMVGRIVAGIGNGINTVRFSTAPVWQGETSKANWRGKLVVIEMILNIAGFALSNWVTYGMSFATGSIVWRFPLALQFLFIIILYATVPWLPESPRWLIAKGRKEEANIILADLEAKDVLDPYVISQAKDIQWAVDFERENAIPWSMLLRGKTGKNGGTWTIRRLLLGMGSQAMQQFSGINVTSYYLPLVLISSVGLEEKLARLLAACNSLSYLLFSLIGIPNVERWGRRKMMMYAASGQFFCYLIITVCIRYNEDTSIGTGPQTQWAKASVAFFFLYYVFFGIGWQGVPWLYPTEINSLSMRTKGAALGTATNWIVNFMVVEITPIGIDSIGWRFYIIWTYFLYPETADRSLEDIDRFFMANQSIFVHNDPDAKSSKRPERYIVQEREEVNRISHTDPGDVQAALNRVGAAEHSDEGRKDEETGLKTDHSHVEKTSP
ncbi:hypothetical protein MGN70_002353 [Eutypa lata]|nr:hypothetical protein MGN70_002353 [Eutypa lata]